MHADMAMRRSPCSTPTYARTLTKQNAGATLCRTGSPLGRLGCAEGHRTARTTRPAIAPACDAHAAATHGCACKRSPHSWLYRAHRSSATKATCSSTISNICACMQSAVCCSQRSAATPPATRAAPELAVRKCDRWRNGHRSRTQRVRAARAVARASRVLERMRCARERARAKVGRYVAGWQSWHRALAEAYLRRPISLHFTRSAPYT